MKQVLIVRHAKSSWDFPGLSDHERPLNTRGQRDAPKMAALMNKVLNFGIDYIYSSHAVRANTTAEIFHETLSIEPNIDIRKDIYHGDTSDIMHIINETEEKYSSIAIFGHNPGFTYFINMFSSEFIDNLPTCGCGSLVSSADNWADFSQDNTKLTHVFIPKELIY